MYRISSSSMSVREFYLKVLLQMWRPPPQSTTRPSSLPLGEMNGCEGLRATHRFTSLTRRGVCCEWGMIDTAATGLRGKQAEVAARAFLSIFIILMRAAGRRAWQQRRGGIWHWTCPSGTPGIHPPWCIARVISLVACFSFLVFFPPHFFIQPVLDVPPFSMLRPIPHKTLFPC